MKFSQTTLLLLVISATVALLNAQDIVLPNFGLNNDAPNCQNAAGLLTIANNDVSRITRFVNGDLSNAAGTAKQALQQAQQACQAQKTLATQLLEVKSSSKLRAKNQFVGTLLDLPRIISSTEMQDPELYHSTFSNKIHETAKTLIQLNEQILSNANQGKIGFDVVCGDVQTSIQNLVNYLTGLSSKINSQTLGTDLPQRISNINAVINNCNAAITQTSTWFKAYWGTSSDLALTPSRIRTDLNTVTFPQAFAYAPSVAVALYHLDTLNNNPGLIVEAINPTPTGFTIKVTAPANSPVYGIGVSWIATLSDKSNIYVQSHFINRAVDPDVQRVFNTKADRTISRSVALPVGLQNPKSMAYLRGFEYVANLNIRLSVSMSDASTLNYFFWYDSIINGAYATIITWSGSDNIKTTANTETNYNGVVKQGSGERYQSFDLSLSNYKAAPEIFWGMWYIDLDSGDNFRVTQKFNVAYPRLNIQTGTWANSGIYMLKNNIFYTCKTADPSRCRA